MVINTEGRVIISDILKDELKRKLEEQEIQALFSNLLTKDTKCSGSTLVRASKISKRRRIPFGDAIHAMIAREQNAILVTRDNHFDSLRDVCIITKPEQLIRVS
jgi:predicted nucleic acid-binding protein